MQRKTETKDEELGLFLRNGGSCILLWSFYSFFRGSVMNEAARTRKDTWRSHPLGESIFHLAYVSSTRACLVSFPYFLFGQYLCLTNSIVVNETASSILPLFPSLTTSKLISGLETGFWCPSETSLLPFVALRLYLVVLLL